MALDFAEPQGRLPAGSSLFRAAYGRVLQTWRSVAQSPHAFAWLALFTLCLTVPPALFRGYHYVEGLTVTISQSALDGGHWLTPFLNNLRWIERPTLLSWIIAAIGSPVGHITPFIARLPVVIFLLGGCFLVWRTIRNFASGEAALFGTLLFLSSPIVIKYYALAVADIPLSVTMFAAFYFWWQACEAKSLTVWRWAGIGLVMAFAALFKGPQPIAYFFLGIGSYIVLTRSWWQIRGLAIAAVIALIPVSLWYASVFHSGDQSEWARYTRLASDGATWPNPIWNAIEFVGETCPAAALALAVAIASVLGQKFAHSRLLLALGCYAVAGTLAVLLWPAVVNPRYILPATPALSVIGGIAFDLLQGSSSKLLLRISACVMALFLAYGVERSINDLFLRPAFIEAKETGGTIDAIIVKDPAPLYRTNWHGGLNELPYASAKVLTINPDQIASIATPAWIVVPSPIADSVVQGSGGHITKRLVFGSWTLVRANPAVVQSTTPKPAETHSRKHA